MTRGGRSPATGAPQAAALAIRLASWDDDPPLGGQGVYLRELRRALQARGLQVSTVAGRGRWAVPHPTVTGRGHLDLSVHLNRRPGLLVDGDPAVVHLSGGPGGLQLLRRLQLPVVYTAHHTHRQSPGWARLRRVFDRLERRSYELADHVVAVSPSTADAVVAMGVPAHKVVVISPGVACADLASGPEPVPGRMLFLGRLEPEKGPLDAVAAMRLVIDAVPAAHGHVVGDGSLAPAVRAAARGAPITVTGRVDDAAVAAELRQAQVVLMPSAFEGLGLVALEAMAAGACVVGYDVAGLHDTIGSWGDLVPAGRVDALADACRRLLRDDGLRQERAAAARHEVETQRSWGRCAAELEALYRSLVR